MTRTAVYSIARDEIGHVQRWLDTTEGFDVRLVVDTGSTDGTAEALEAAGVTVYRVAVQPWRFDIPRNAALALLPADVDVCLTLDMDEVLADGFAEQLRTAWKTDSHRGWVTFDTGSEWSAPRVHSRHGWIWRYPIHEVLDWVGDGKPTEQRLALRMAHLPDVRKSRGQYLPMLKRAVAEFPTDARMFTYLIREQYFHHEWKPILAFAAYALGLGGWSVDQAAICRYASTAAAVTGDTETALAWAHDAVNYSDDAETQHNLALVAYWAEDWSTCLQAAEAALDRPQSRHHYHDASIKAWRAADLASIACHNLGDRAGAVRYATAALVADSPDRERIADNVRMFEGEAQ